MSVRMIESKSFEGKTGTNSRNVHTTTVEQHVYLLAFDLSLRIWN
jgi:hypothetical protein